MRIKLIFNLFLAVVFVANFVTAKSEQKRRRPSLDVSAQDSDGNYVDQIALDSINYQSQSQSLPDPSENYPPSFFTGNNLGLKKLKKPSTEQKVQYVTPETYSAPPKIKDNSPSSYAGYTYLNRTSSETRRPTTSKQKLKTQNDYADYSYYFPESKRINAKTPAKASTAQNSFEKFYQPQSADAVVHKEVSKDGDELTYHYYYPSEESTQIDHKPSFPSSTISPSSTFSPSSLNFSPSSTFSPSTTRAPSLKQSTKKKAPTSSFHHTIQHTSTDPYQYPPVLQRPTEYELNGSDAPQQNFYPSFENNKVFKTQSTLAPSTATPIKMLKPTKKNNYYLPSSTLSPSSTTAKHMKIRRPSSASAAVQNSFEKFSLPPSVSTTMAPHYSTTTRSPELYKYSTVSPISSTTLSDFYIKPSTQVTPTITSASSDLYSAGSNERTVVIKPKVQYTAETYEQQPTIKETVVYKYVDPDEYYGYESNKTDNEIIYPSSVSSYETAKIPEYYGELNSSTQADMDFYNSFHKNYNYEYFTEQDAGKLPDDGESKMDQNIAESDIIDDKQRASKKNMIFAIAPEPRYPSSSIIPVNVQDHEVPPPMTDNDNELTPEASKNQQYYVLYSVDDDNRRERKQKKKVKQQEPEVVYHHHHHEHQGGDKEYEEDFQQFDNEFDSEFDSDLVNSDNVRIVDPSVRGGRPLEFTKDDYLRHIKQAVVQYMKNIHNTKDSSVSSSTNKVKSQRYQESIQDSRPTKASIPASILSSTAGYKSTLGPQQYKSMASLKLPKNVYTADKLKDAIDDIQESPQIDLTLKKAKVKPFDLSAIDVGQTYQHVTQFDHSGALRNVEEFDQSHAMTGNTNKQKLHFSQQTYHDINNLGHNNQKQKQTDDNDNENSYKGYILPSSKYGAKLVTNQNQNTFSAMNYDANKLPRIVSQQNNDDDDDENKVDDTIDAPIQIINGIPVANPYNIDLNTLKYMLGGIAQAEVNDQIKDLDESSTQKFSNNWKAFSPVGSFTSNNPIYQVYGPQKTNDAPSQKAKKNQQPNNSNKQQSNKFPLVGTLVNFNKMKNSQQNRQRNNNNNNNHPIKTALNVHDYSNWNQINKKQRTEPQASSSQNVFVLRPAIRNKHARDDRKPTVTRLREPARDMRPPPPLKPKQSPHLLVARIK